MGTQLVREIEALNLAQDTRMKGLPPTSRLVLLGMAMSALDKSTQTNEARCYFRGWDYLAVNYLGHHPAPDTTGERAVARAILQLVRRGLISTERQRHGFRGPRIYRLHLLDFHTNDETHSL